MSKYLIGDLVPYLLEVRIYHFSQLEGRQTTLSQVTIFHSHLPITPLMEQWSNSG